MDDVIARLDAPAKLTLSLRVVGVRDDGYHLIDAEMVTLSLVDRLVIRPGSGVVISGGAATSMAGPTAGDDLVSAALRMVGRSVRVDVDKEIPPGAGLGGGSADAAAILRWAGHSDAVEAASLGADVAFCLRGGRARVRGIGEIIDALPRREQTFTLATSGVHCSTPRVYARWDEMGGPVEPGDEGNDLTAAALAEYPELQGHRDRLGEATGRTPRLAGSGSTWFVEGAHPGGGRCVVTTLG